jgi:hypothetical protein
MWCDEWFHSKVGFFFRNIEKIKKEKKITHCA